MPTDKPFDPNAPRNREPVLPGERYPTPEELAARPPTSDLHNWYDTDQEKLREVIAQVTAKYCDGRDNVDLEMVRRELIDRCADVGSRVTVVGMIPDTHGEEWNPRRHGLGMNVIYEGPIDPKESAPGQFDHERKAFEIVHDVAGIEPEKAGIAIGPNGEIRSPAKSVSFSVPGSDTTQD